MAANQVEKNAIRLHKYLQERGKFFDKSWRQRIRKLLADTYEAMNAKPIDGNRCRAVSDQIEAELAVLDQMSFDDMPEVSVKKSSDKSKTRTTKKRAAQQSPSHSDDSSEPRVSTPSPAKADDSSSLEMVVDSSLLSTNGDRGDVVEDCDKTDREAVVDSAADSRDDGVGQTNTVADAADSIGLFDLIHVEIRCLIKIRAVVRPPFIGKFVEFAEDFAQKRESRIEAFIAVLSPSTDELSNKMEVEVGYDDDLIPNMPGFDLVLHPKKKKR